MSGTKQHELKGIFDSFKYSWQAALNQELKAFRENIREIAEDVERHLGLEADTPIEGKTRVELMLGIKGIIDALEAYQNCDTSEIEHLQAELDACRERERIQSELLELYRQMMSANDIERQTLQSKIDQLNRQIEESSRKTTSRRKVTEQETPEQKRARIEKHIERAVKRQAMLYEELGKLDPAKEDSDSPEEHSDYPGSNSGTSSESLYDSSDLETGCSGDEPDPQIPAEPVFPDTPSNEALLSPDESEGTAGSTVPSSPDVHCNIGPSDSTEEAGSAGQSSEEYLKRIRELEEQLKQKDAALEEYQYSARKGSRDSNKPSGKLAPWESCKGEKNGSSTKGRDGSAYIENPELSPEEQLAQMEAAAEEAALHDPNKSPFKTPGGKRGKPIGANGDGRRMPVYDEAEVCPCNPEKCLHCPHRATCQALNDATQQAKTQGNSWSSCRKVFDIRIVRKVTEYRMVSCVCPEDGQAVSGAFPAGVNSAFQYGPGLKALVIALNTVGMVSYLRIADIVKGLIGDSQFSHTTACSWVNDFAKEKLGPVGKYIKAGVFSGSYLNNDESGVKVKGVLHWVHVACNMTLTYMRVDKHRGDRGMSHIGILPAYMGTVITDCWASYWGKGSKHGLCNAHLLRELFALVKFFVRDREWAQKMTDLLNEMNDERNKLKAANITEFPKEKIQDFHNRYREIVEEGLEIHPDSEAVRNGRGKPKKFRGRNLLDRLKEHEDNFLLFLDDFSVSFTNNDAERSLRLFSVKRSIVGGFDTYEGADNFALIWSYIASARKRKYSAYEAIVAALEGNAVEFLFDKEEIAMLDEVIPKLSDINKNQFLKDREADKAELLKAREDTQKKLKRADEAKVAAEQAAEKAKAEMKRHADSEKATKRAQRAIDAAQKAQATAAKNAVAAKNAQEKADALEEYVRCQAKAALYFLDIEDFEWNFDEAMFG